MRRAELIVAAALALTALAAIGFIVVYADGADTQLLGLALGLALLFLAAAAILASRTLFAQAAQTEERPEYARPNFDPRHEATATKRALVEPPARVTRRRLLGTAAGGAGLALGGALAVPLASLGPSVGSHLTEDPWRAGRRLVDENDRPITADTLEEGGFLTAFPEGIEHDLLAAPVVLVRVAPESLDLPSDRAGWAPNGLLAYSKICTHAGCAINLYRTPLYPPRSPRPALVCPCHYSTFDVRRGAEVIFGPAGRPLPQLPLRIDETNYLVAGGPLSGPVGPAWRGVRES